MQSNSFQSPSPAVSSPSFAPPVFPYMYSPTSMYGTPSAASLSYLPFPMIPQRLPFAQYVTSNTPSTHTNQNPPKANIACVSPIVQTDTNWFLDSDDTNHLTNVALAPQLTTSYKGPGKFLLVMVFLFLYLLLVLLIFLQIIDD